MVVELVLEKKEPVALLVIGNPEYLLTVPKN